MKKIAIFTLNLLVFLIFLIYFFPKENLYYLLEQNLQKAGIVLSDEKTKDKGLQFETRDTRLFYNGVEAAGIKKMRFDIFLFYNAIAIKEIRLQSIAQSFVPLSIERADIKYTIVDPLHIKARIKGEFGEATLFLHLLDKKVSVILSPSEIMLQKYKNSLKKFKKSENGEYVYEQDI